MKQQLRKFIVDNFLFGMDDHNFSDADSLLEKGLIDSTGVLELVAFLEEQFGVKVEDHELIPENLDSIDRLQRFVDRKALADDTVTRGKRQLVA